MQRGDKIGPYELSFPIGEGAMAQVWCATHQNLVVPRALKFLTHPGRESRRRFLTEARAQAMIDHPNVVRVHDVFEFDSMPIIVMDLVEGESLDAWSRLERTPEAIEWVIVEILEGLAAIHRAGFVHRDLKPSNILVDRRSHRAIIADMGIARPIRGSGTRTGALMGTPAYMAPEQTDDATAASPRSDLFALGLVALTLVTGEPVFLRETVRETLVAIHHCEEVLASIELPDEPRLARVNELIRALVRYDPEERPATAAACLEILGVPQRSIVPVLPTPALSEPPSTPMTKNDSRRWGLAGTMMGMAAGGLLALALGGGLGTGASASAAAAEHVLVAPASTQVEVLPTGGTVGPPDRTVEVMPDERERKGLFGGLFRKKGR